jgi:hypothetical protein
VDPLEPRILAMRLLDDVLAGRIARIGDLRRAWPREGDFLVTRARQEAEHLLVTRGDVERRIVALLRRFLETGGTRAELEQAYDAVIRAADAASDAERSGSGDRSR